MRSYLLSSLAASFFTCAKQAVKANIHAKQSLMFAKCRALLDGDVA